ncbi:MAG: hypothetical protein ACE5GS_08620 [Kiloniellaceae bacterium]
MAARIWLARVLGATVFLLALSGPAPAEPRDLEGAAWASGKPATSGSYLFPRQAPRNGRAPAPLAAPMPKAAGGPGGTSLSLSDVAREAAWRNATAARLRRMTRPWPGF